MAERATITDGAARQIQFQEKFRARFVGETPTWYHGLIHLGFTLTVTIGTAAVCWAHIQGATAWEWLIVVPIFLITRLIKAGNRRG